MTRKLKKEFWIYITLIIGIIIVCYLTLWLLNPMVCVILFIFLPGIAIGFGQLFYEQYKEAYKK